MSHIEQEQLYKQIFDALPVGLILIAQDYSIYAWNQWMANNTHIDIKKAIGHSLHSLYPNYSNARFDWALDVVIHNGHPQVLSTILNKYVIPIPLAKTAYIDLGMMQQYVEILPFHYHTQNMALVVIQDVSDKTHQKNTLITMAARFEESSLLDALTGLYNRRFLWKFLENEMQTAKRKNY
jgi:diguanylate cyclase